MNQQIFADYKVGLVLTRSGLNGNQLTFLRHHLKELARTAGTPLDIAVPVVVSHGDTTAGPSSLKLTERLIAPLRELGAWAKIHVVGVADILALMPILKDMDEVWCATSKGSGSEWYMRPGAVYRRGQTLREAPRFKMLHYWVELDPKLIPSRETKKGKKPPALKGY